MSNKQFYFFKTLARKTYFIDAGVSAIKTMALSSRTLLRTILFQRRCLILKSNTGIWFDFYIVMRLQL